MEKSGLEDRIRAGGLQMGLVLEERLVDSLGWLGSELLRWNARTNLTSLTEPDDLVEQHLLEAVWLVQRLGVREGSLLDLGSGPGFPGLPIALAAPGLTVTLVEATFRKVGFSKHAAARLGLARRLRSVHGRAEGDPGAEGLVTADWLVSKALVAGAEWVRLALPYLSPGGRILLLEGRERAEVEASQVSLIGEESYELPFSGVRRRVRVFERA